MVKMKKELELKEVIDKSYNKILKMSLFYLKDREEAVDLTQDICIKICKKLNSFQNRSDINTWIYRVAKNTIFNYIRRKKLVNFISFDKVTFSQAPESVIDKNTPQQLMLEMKNAV